MASNALQGCVLAGIRRLRRDVQIRGAACPASIPHDVTSRGRQRGPVPRLAAGESPAVVVRRPASFQI